MSLLAEIRRAGSASVREDGQVVVRGIEGELLARAKASKAEIEQALRDEGLTGIKYWNSAYWLTIEELYDAAKSASYCGVMREESLRIIAIAKELDEAFCEDYDAGVALLAVRSQEIAHLADRAAVKSGYLLEGRNLHEAARQELLKPDVDEGALAA